MKTWPELVGTHGDDAASVIKRENPSFNVFVLLIGSIVTRPGRSGTRWHSGRVLRVFGFSGLDF